MPLTKLICTDIDGTLLDKDRLLSINTIRALKQLREQCHIILASSRMPAAMRHLQEQLNIPDQPLICYNGAYVVDQGQVLHSTVIPMDVVELVSQEANKIHVSIYQGEQWLISNDDQWSAREIHNTKATPNGLISKEHTQDWSGAHKIMCMGDGQQIDKLVALLKNEADAGLHLYRSKDTYLEIAPRSVSKATALALLVNRLHVDWSQMIAFGDNYNDIEMLKAVGVGVAVANAKAEVRQIADQLTDSNIDDGVANFLKRHFQLDLEP